MLITDMARKDFDALRFCQAGDSNICDSVVIYPNRTIHESGWRTITVVAVVDGMAMYKATTCSDVIHIDGIGGKKSDEHTGWNMDYLKKSALLHMWLHGKKIKLEMPLSSYEFIAVDA